MPEDYRILPPLGGKPEPDPKVRNDVNRILETISAKRKRIPNLADIVEKLIDRWGGAENFANAYYTEYKNSPSIAFRGRMLESILRLMQAYAATAGPQEEISGLSEDELRSVAASLLGPFYAQQKEADARLERAAADQEAKAAEGKSDIRPSAASTASEDRGRGGASPSQRDSNSWTGAD